MSDMLKRLMELADLPYTPKVVEPLVEAKEEESVPDQHAEGTLIEEEALSETAAAAAALIAQVDKGMPAKAGDNSSTFVPVDVAKMGDEKEVNELKPEEAKASKVPAEITSQINQRIAEIKASIEKYNDKGYNDGGAKGNAVDALEQIKTDLAKGEDGFLAAQIFLGTLMNPITNLFPPKLIKFLANQMPPSVEKNTTVKEGFLVEATGVKEEEFFKDVQKHFPGATKKTHPNGVTNYEHEGKSVGYHDAVLRAGGHTKEDPKNDKKTVKEGAAEVQWHACKKCKKKGTVRFGMYGGFWDGDDLKCNECGAGQPEPDGDADDGGVNEGFEHNRNFTDLVRSLKDQDLWKLVDQYHGILNAEAGVSDDKFDDATYRLDVLDAELKRRGYRRGVLEIDVNSSGYEPDNVE